jgi:hypothetical protein
MSSFAKSVESPFAAEGGIELPLHREEDPYRALDDLMHVVEVLCPVWPLRDAFRAGNNLLL